MPIKDWIGDPYTYWLREKLQSFFGKRKSSISMREIDYNKMLFLGLGYKN